MFYCLHFSGSKFTSQLILWIIFLIVSVSNILQKFNLRAQLERRQLVYSPSLCNGLCLEIWGYLPLVLQDAQPGARSQAEGLALPMCDGGGTVSSARRPTPPLGSQQQRWLWLPSVPGGLLVPVTLQASRSQVPWSVWTQSPAKPQLQPLLTTVCFVLFLFSRDIYSVFESMSF